MWVFYENFLLKSSSCRYTEAMWSKINYIPWRYCIKIQWRKSVGITHTQIPQHLLLNFLLLFWFLRWDTQDVNTCKHRHHPQSIKMSCRVNGEQYNCQEFSVSQKETKSVCGFVFSLPFYSHSSSSLIFKSWLKNLDSKAHTILMLYISNTQGHHIRVIAVNKLYKWKMSL